MAFFQKYEMHGVKYVHCGDDFWRLTTRDGYVNQRARRFTNQQHIEAFIQQQHEEMERGE